MTFHCVFVRFPTCVLSAENGPASAGGKTARKSKVAGGAQIDLEQVAREQQIKNQKQMEEILASLVAKHGQQLGDKLSLLRQGGGQMNGINGSDLTCGAGAAAARDGAGAAENDTVHQNRGRSDQGELNKVTGKVDQRSALQSEALQSSKLVRGGVNFSFIHDKTFNKCKWDERDIGTRMKIFAWYCSISYFALIIYIYRTKLGTWFRLFL